MINVLFDMRLTTRSSRITTTVNKQTNTHTHTHTKLKKANQRKEKKRKEKKRKEKKRKEMKRKENKRKEKKRKENKQISTGKNILSPTPKLTFAAGTCESDLPGLLPRSIPSQCKLSCCPYQ